MISVDDYFKGYPDHPEITEEMRAAAAAMLEKVNQLREQAAADGVAFRINPHTGSPVSGERNGGWRPQACPIGAPRSKHKTAHAVDNYDPEREFASWCRAHLHRLIEIGLWMEDARWTPTWLHLQDQPPGNPPVPARVVFIPDNSPPKVPHPRAWNT